MQATAKKPQSANDESFMRRCLELAQRGIGCVAPNPLVGALLVHKGEIVAEGWHQKFGGPHAEVNAIRALKNQNVLHECTLYVNLEPCCHFGKTPPCTELILKSGIPRVVIGCRDLFPQVAGAGIDILRQAGLDVRLGVLESECLELNRRFFTFHDLKRPYVILKWAETKDGFIAREDNTSKWISAEESRTLLHRWRSEESAIMIGTNTALIDNPMLTVRHVEGRNPVRVVMDRNLRLPRDLHLFDSSTPTLVFNQLRQEKPSENLEYIKIEFDEKILEHVLAELYKHNLLSCIVEGGARLLNSFVLSSLWDEARVFVSPATFGMGLRGPLLARKDYNVVASGPDELRTYRNQAIVR